MKFWNRGEMLKAVDMDGNEVRVGDKVFMPGKSPKGIDHEFVVKEVRHRGNNSHNSLIPEKQPDYQYADYMCRLKNE